MVCNKSIRASFVAGDAATFCRFSAAIASQNPTQGYHSLSMMLKAMFKAGATIKKALRYAHTGIALKMFLVRGPIL